jgi:hypothetical protein
MTYRLARTIPILKVFKIDLTLFRMFNKSTKPFKACDIQLKKTKERRRKAGGAAKPIRLVERVSAPDKKTENFAREIPHNR